MVQAVDLSLVGLWSEAATRCGSDLKAALAELGAEIVRDRRPFPHLPLDFLVALFTRLEARATRGHFPFALAEAFNFNGQPAITTFLASADSLRHATRLLDWVPALIHPAFRIEAIEQEQRAWLQIRVAEPASRHRDPPLVVELIAAVVARLCRSLAPDTEAIRAVHFAHAPQVAAALYAEQFRCPVGFEAGETRIEVDAQALDLALPGRLPQAHARAEEALRVSLLGGSQAPSLSLQIEELLRGRSELLGAGIEAVAAALHLQPRTLQRRLREEDARYADIVARIRHRLACELLRSRELDIESIAMRLGYVERRSFTQAFRLWQGQSPADYRRQLRGRPGTTNVSS